MRHDWIIDVLTDLQTFARANNLEALAGQLDDTRLVAQVEIASTSARGAIGLCGATSRSGRVPGAA